MTESERVRKLLKELRATQPESCVIFKHADNFTVGVPDISISLYSQTFWFECKLLSRLGKDKLQQHILKRLWNATSRAYYIVFDDKQPVASLMYPDIRNYVPGLIALPLKEFVRKLWIELKS